MGSPPISSLLSSSNIQNDIFIFTEGQSLHDPEVYLLDYCPPELRIEVSKQFALGYANFMDSIAYLLKQGQLPKPRMVAQCAPILPGVDKEASKIYLSANGVAEYALDAVLAQCESSGGEASAAGPGPECALDGKWELLRQHLFSNSEFWPCGPYPMDDEGGDVGEDGGDGWVYYDNSNWKPPAQK